MRIKLFRSATVGVYSGSKSILMDPWLEDGEYMGSWSHFPQYNLDKSINEINSFDAIYISHIHPDHCSDATMKKISKTIPIYIHSYHAKFLKLKLQRLGFNVFELKHGVRNKIFKDFYITIYAADDCNPELCYRYFGCADLSLKETNSLQIDSLAVIDNNKNTIVNVNDCSFELSKNVINKINQKFEKIDVLLHGYCGAGPYPQCFENLDNNQKILAGKKKENYFLKQGLSFIKEFKPKYFLPFAGTYMLTGKLSKLHRFRGVPMIDSAYSFFETEVLKINNLNAKPIKIQNEGCFDIVTGTTLQEYKKINYEDYYYYLDHVLSKKKLSYENEEMPNFDEIFSLAENAQSKFIDKKLINNVKLDTDIYISDFKNFIKIPSDDKSIDKVSEIDTSKKFVNYSLDRRLLKKILNGPRFAHWNNAEIGSHIIFNRNYDEYDRKLYNSMLFYHN